MRPRLCRRFELLRPDGDRRSYPAKIRPGAGVKIIVVIRVGERVYQPYLRGQSELPVKIHPARVTQNERVGIGFHQLPHKRAALSLCVVFGGVKTGFIGFLPRGRSDSGLTLRPPPQPFPAAKLRNHPLSPAWAKQHVGLLPRAEMGLGRLYQDADMPPELIGDAKRGAGMDQGGEELGAKKGILRPERRELGKRAPGGYAVIEQHAVSISGVERAGMGLRNPPEIRAFG